MGVVLFDTLICSTHLFQESVNFFDRSQADIHAFQQEKIQITVSNKLTCRANDRFEQINVSNKKTRSINTCTLVLRFTPYFTRFETTV